jgi:ABC-type Fe3+-hydroxamate transport system substrate-binding protein
VRVVSLVPSVTETLLAWGVSPVAVTRFCEQPGYLTVGGTKDPDIAAIVALRPDLVVVNDEENRREDADALRAAGLTLHVTTVRSVADVAPCLTALASAVDAPEPAVDPPFRAQPVRETARGRPSAHRVREIGGVVAGDAEDRGDAGVSAFVPIWRRPWMTMNGDTYGSSVLDAIGVANIYAADADRYPTVTLGAAAARSPDLVLAPSEPYPFKPRHAAELRQVAPDVRFVDGQDLFWWGVRTPAAIDRLTHALTSAN